MGATRLFEEWAEIERGLAGVAIDTAARVVITLSELTKAGVLGISPRGAHIADGLFKARFGVGDNVMRNDMGGYIRCSTTYKGVEFYALFKIPAGVYITEGNPSNIKSLDIYSVEL